MQPRVEPGRIEHIDTHTDRGTVALDSGSRIAFERDWNRPMQAGWRVLVTFGSQGQAVRVGLDLTPIGMTELEASEIAKVRERFDALGAAAPLTQTQRELFAAVIETHRHSMGKDARKLRDRIERAIDGDTLPITMDDAWADAARGELAGLPNRDSWIGLLGLDGDGAKPTKKWLVAAAATVARIGSAAFVDTVRRWFARVAPRKVTRDEGNWYAPAMADANADALRNLIWACSTIDAGPHTEALAVAIGDLAVRCFTKISGVGALSMKAGNACIYVLSQLTGMRAVAQLSRLGSRVRYKQALALVDKAKLECARRAGVPPIDLEELSLPTFGLDVTGRARIALGEHVAELAIVDDDSALAFFEGTRQLKSVPAAVKSAHAGELAELKTTRKELAALLPTVRARLERWLVEPRSWSLADLRTRYIDHPLVAQLARRVIFATGDTSVIFVDGFALDRAGKPVELADNAELSLWHPLGRPASEVAAWRELFAALAITQPFKQLDRELYVAADGAARRFAGKVVRQHQLAALCRERGWAYSLQGTFDGGNAPTKSLPWFDLDAELDIDIADDAPIADSGIYLQVVTGELHFTRQRAPVRLADVPARCFSEVMRDVDLFVSGAGIAAS